MVGGKIWSGGKIWLRVGGEICFLSTFPFTVLQVTY